MAEMLCWPTNTCYLHFFLEISLPISLSPCIWGLLISVGHKILSSCPCRPARCQIRLWLVGFFAPHLQTPWSFWALSYGQEAGCFCSSWSAVANVLISCPNFICWTFMALLALAILLADLRFTSNQFLPEIFQIPRYQIQF